MGSVGDQIGVAGVLVFGGQYVAWGHDHESLPWAWVSRDGATWTGTRLGSMIQPCPGWAEDNDSQVHAGATDGRHVVLVGLEYARNASRCDAHDAASWVSDDARTWRRGVGFGGETGFADSKWVWAANGQWEALAWTGGDRPRTLWRSADGLAWSGLGPIDVPAELEAWVTAAPDGTRLMTVRNAQDGSNEETFGLLGGQSRLRSSRDGLNWGDVAYDFNAGHASTALIVAIPRAPETGDAWIVFGPHDEQVPVDVWRSSDLRSWQHGTFPMADLSGLAWTRYGYIATGRNTGCGDGGACPPNPSRQFISPDGVSWSPLGSDIEADLFIDGPSGLLAIDGDSGVWLLE